MGAGGDAGAEESQGNQDASARDEWPAAPKTEPSSRLVWHPSEGWFLLAGSLLHHCYLLVHVALPTPSPEGDTHLQGEAAPSCGPCRKRAACFSYYRSRESTQCPGPPNS